MAIDDNVRTTTICNNAKDYQKGKKKLPRPFHTGHFVSILILKFCQAILFVDTNIKIGIYVVGVMLLSVICELFILPKSYLSANQNIVNQYFVKKGWGWTLLIVGIYVTLSSCVYCCGHWAMVRRHVSRLVVATSQWYICVNVFTSIEHTVGVCNDRQYAYKDDCDLHGKTWSGFDISGHVFLLIHCLLVMSEEVKVFKEWRSVGYMLDDNNLVNKRNITGKEIDVSKYLYNYLTPYIKIVFAIMALFTLLWEFMLVVSVVYRFHTLPQKVIALLVAVFCWFLSYRVLYTTGIKWLPCAPGKSKLNFIKGHVK